MMNYEITATNMQITISIELDGLNSTRTFQGTPEDLASNDWNERVAETIEDMLYILKNNND